MIPFLSTFKYALNLFILYALLQPCARCFYQDGCLTALFRMPYPKALSGSVSLFSFSRYLSKWMKAFAMDFIRMRGVRMICLSTEDLVPVGVKKISAVSMAPKPCHEL